MIDGKIVSQMRERSVINRTERVMGTVNTGGKENLVCTDKRIIRYNPKWFGRWESDSFPLEHVSYVGFNAGIFRGTLIIKSGNTEIELKMKKKDGNRMQGMINNQIIIRKAEMSGAEIPEVNPMMELQLKFVHGEIDEDEYLRRMTLL